MVKSAFPSFIFKLINTAITNSKITTCNANLRFKKICASLLVHSVPNLPGPYLLDILIFRKNLTNLFAIFMNTWGKQYVTFIPVIHFVK